jgi:crossover junction endodeoxyribonuclease RuvC
MIRTLLSLADRPGADAADALAVAVCHAHQRQLHARIHCGSGPHWSRA